MFSAFLTGLLLRTGSTRQVIEEKLSMVAPDLVGGIIGGAVGVVVLGKSQISKQKIFWTQFF